MSINSIFLAIAFISISTLSYSQNDTVYFNANWEKSGQGGYAYFRVISFKGDHVQIADFYGNGEKQMSGSIVSSEEALETAKSGQDVSSYSFGKFHYYNQNGSSYLFIDYDPDYKSLLDSTEMASVNVDSLTHEKTFYTNGAVNEESLFTGSGAPHGKKAKYTKNGKLVYSTQFNNGVKNGPSVFYYPNGNVMSTTQFKDGLKDGEKIKYDSKGKVKSIKKYKKGEVVE